MKITNKDGAKTTKNKKLNWKQFKAITATILLAGGFIYAFVVLAEKNQQIQAITGIALAVACVVNIGEYIFNK